ncbi:MAG: superoxide dismutase, partial [Bacteroidales bacterium]|nr:superoxide dismutase [Bacteroidales bacterium]
MKKILFIFIVLFALQAAKTNAQNTSFEFPALPYSYDALEPYIDKATMEIHYDRHFRAYYNNFIKAVNENNLNGKSLEEIFSDISKYPASVRNNGGGYYNHSLFWTIMAPNAGGKPEGKLMDAVTITFGSFENFVKDFEKAAATQFGSGWAWLIVDENNQLAILQLPNQDNPLMDISPKKGTPILAIDVWEHAYYLKYQNKRA